MNPAQAARQPSGEAEPRREEGLEGRREEGTATESPRHDGPGRQEAGRATTARSETEEPRHDGSGRQTARGELEESERDETELDEEEDIERMAVRVLSRARQRIREQPLTAATGAFIVGFAFGNGVPKFLARAGVAIGLRMVMQRMFDRAEMFEADE